MGKLIRSLHSATLAFLATWREKPERFAPRIVCLRDHRGLFTVVRYCATAEELREIESFRRAQERVTVAVGIC